MQTTSMISTNTSNEKIVELTIDVINEYKIHSKPTPPQSYLVYLEKKKENKYPDPAFWTRNDVSQYLNTMQCFEHERLGRIDHLKWCLRHADTFQEVILQEKIDQLNSVKYWSYSYPRGPVLDAITSHDRFIQTQHNITGWTD